MLDQHVTVADTSLEEMIRSLVLRRAPDRQLLDAVAAGDIDAVRMFLARLSSQPNVCHSHASCV